MQKFWIKMNICLAKYLHKILFKLFQNRNMYIKYP